MLYTQNPCQTKGLYNLFWALEYFLVTVTFLYINNVNNFLFHLLYYERRNKLKNIFLCCYIQSYFFIPGNDRYPCFLTHYIISEFFKLAQKEYQYKHDCLVRVQMIDFNLSHKLMGYTQRA